MLSTRRLGEAKLLEDVFNETNTELLGNLMKGIHLDGGGKASFYKDQAIKILAAAGIVHTSLNNDKTVDNVARVLYENDYNRLTAIRSSMLKRSVLIKLRMNSNGKNIKFEDYANALSEAIADTTNHSKKLLPAAKAG
ncbi:hypothetical protein CCP1ISM_470005 [Azospirillaceae bacterium]